MFDWDLVFLEREGWREKSENLSKICSALDFAKSSAGGGSHRIFMHTEYSGAVTISGKAGGDAKPYQEKQVKRTIEAVHENN